MRGSVGHMLAGVDRENVRRLREHIIRRGGGVYLTMY